MAFDEALAQRIRRELARRKNVEEKKMFGGIGFLLNGNLLVGVRKMPGVLNSTDFFLPQLVLAYSDL